MTVTWPTWKHSVRVNHSVWFAKKAKHTAAFWLVQNDSNCSISILFVAKIKKQKQTCLHDSYSDSINLIKFSPRKKEVFKYFIKLIWQCKHEKQANSICLSFLCKTDWNQILACRIYYIESVHWLTLKGGHFIWMNYWF